MNTTAATSVDASAERSLLSRLRRKRAGRSVSFPELVWIHYLRQEELKNGHHRPYEGPATSAEDAIHDLALCEAIIRFVQDRRPITDPSAIPALASAN